MHSFFAGLVVGVFGGGALSYLYSSYVQRKAKAALAAAEAAASAVKKA